MTSAIKLGQPVPNFKFKATSQRQGELKDFKGKKIVLYFYPKDNTPGCTNESKQFGQLYTEFQRADTEILGISRDNLHSHEKFKAKYELPFELISDEDETICRQFDVIRSKLMFGKSIFGLIRSTFVIDSNQVLRKEWRKVQVKGHVQEVLEFVKSL